MTFILRLGTLLALLISLSGCVSLMAPLGSEPMDRNHGERTFGAFIEDNAIETKIRVNIKRSSEPLKKQRIVVVSFNGQVLLAGQVNNAEQKRAAEEIARSIRHVEEVHNELTQSGKISWLARVNDSWITSKVKTRLAFSRDTDASRTKVVTENGVVYLLGLMTRAEADAVVKRVQKVYGVQKIVKIIEYIDR